MGDVYSMRMLAMEFWALTQNDWSLYPKESFECLPNGTIRHETMTNGDKFHSGTVDIIAPPPPESTKKQGVVRTSTMSRTEPDSSSIGQGLSRKFQ
jgi:hypothetical protein